ncbi:MAG TPA: hypothetical protein VK001_04470, partial [Geminicoccaceae bacterium]|nr:hypothetical protein [Geminicoccaceae bacterium]
MNLPAFRWGWHEGGGRVRHWRCREIEIHTATSLPINTDGEVTTRTPAVIRVVPKAVAVHVPEAFLAGAGEAHAAG